MIKKIYIILIIFLLISLPIINSSLFDLLGIHLGLNVNGNYEFTKIIYFNILSSIILATFLVKIIIQKQKVIFPKILIFILIIFFISTYFSISPYISFFGNEKKGHGFLMFLNLIGLLIIFLTLEKKEKKKILKYSLIGLFLSCIIAIWQLYFPTFNYGNLSNRALGTFGHPNYLALYLLLYLPIILNNKIKLNNNLNIGLLILTITTLILTKSIIAIIIGFFYIFYFIIKNVKGKNKKIILISVLFFIIFILSYIFYNFGYTKLHSFLSRFFIWITTIEVIFENLKTILIGNGFETLSLVFEKHKSPFLYIFENIGYTADRPHDIFLLFFYSTGFFGLLLISYLLYFILKSKKSAYKNSLILAFIFLSFNFASITSYLLIILFLSFSIKNNNSTKYNLVFFIIIILISIYGAYNSYLFYKAENYINQGKTNKPYNIFKYNPNYYFKNGESKKGLEYINKKTELYYKSIIYFKNNLDNGCKKLTKNYPSVENYFFCGNIYWENKQEKIAKKYYIKGIEKLPDLWNKNSKYYKNIIIKDSINGVRFFSRKYSILTEILKKLGIEIEK